MREHYVIRTPNGYVGRWGLAEPLTDDNPFSGCYCYRSPEYAGVVAAGFGGAVVLTVTDLSVEPGS